MSLLTIELDSDIEALKETIDILQFMIERKEKERLKYLEEQKNKKKVKTIEEILEEIRMEIDNNNEEIDAYINENTNLHNKKIEINKLIESGEIKLGDIEKPKTRKKKF